ncbi:MAG: hypothetical protein GY729_18330, partial [Desulfobacteraceae bacterium]|nr:hypothetical protein [Desulfobacteraceae bacterium]
TCPNEQIYFALLQFFSTVMAYQFPHRSRLFSEHFKLFLPALNAVLKDKGLRQAVKEAIKENQAYNKVLFVTSFKGNCIAWEYKFRPHKTRGLESETFGVSTYSHLVMVDPTVEAKYVKLESKHIMENLYPKEDISSWENRYLGGTDVDDFLKEYSMPFHADAALPFMIDGQWYLPVLKKGYDTDQDCLVIIDATSETHFDAALDELATFGSRYARLVIITQKAYAHDAKLSNLKKYPLSHIILVPGLTDASGDTTVLSDYILPVVMNIIGSALKFLDL